MTLWENLVVSAFTAVIAGPIGAWVALTRFRAERWWEKKAAAYDEIMLALHQMLTEAEQTLEYVETHTEMPMDKRSELSEGRERAHAVIKRQARIGAYLLSPRAEERLRRLEKEHEVQWDNPNYYEQVDSRWSALNSALEDLKRIATEDLRTESSLWSRKASLPLYEKSPQ